MEQEFKTVSVMIDLYCRGHHDSRDHRCVDCEALLTYVGQRLEKCPLKTNHGYKSLGKLRDVIPSAVRDCSTYKFQRTSLLKFEFHNKPKCSKCPVHCYKPDMREKIKAVMRYAGPRMIYRYPILTGKHFLNKN